ncbi:glycosyltransferase family 4 protein [Serratia quinivorans]|jgi:glycosyltransferase involved in cell wall biosynthesis|uniref:glycosyltransferase family 4 protein n=1 Tax=Serratia quinivorans TaxID=137545 RepID=UPI0021786439|nr:glycosyltransferase family 4 protein [Serratia quinivorans]CAI0857865.1 GDP-mannose-dependent alpha-(1-6)-phosphatidylinositol monomannoside mannosyltransferase [Serratia quinivorans]
MLSENISVGVVADWLVTFAGAEKVIKEFFSLYPNAELYSVIDFLSDKSRENEFKNKRANTTFIQNLPKSKNNYQKYLPLMPYAIEQLDVGSHDIIISSSHAVAKGVLTGPDQLHISYIHSPIRYAWDLQHQYLRESGLDRGIKGMLAKYILHKMRIWDCRTVNGVDHFIANSQFIARRIGKVYGREADVIYPPVDVDSYVLNSNKDNYYVTASRLVPYKRVDLVVEAFVHMPTKKLVVIGDGSEMERIKKIAGKSKNIEILGYQSDEAMKELMSKAKAFVFAAEEDFGITPVEAQACGTPVIAFGKGGSLETVRPYGESFATGIHFDLQTVESLVQAVDKFEHVSESIDHADCRTHAEKFSSERFRKEIDNYVTNKWNEFSEKKRIQY